MTAVRAALYRRSMDVQESVALLRELAAQCPRPQTWHPGAEHVAEVFADLEAAVAVITSSPRAQEAFAAELEQPAWIPEPAGPLLAAARDRLSSLPLPEGEHPFVDMIRPTIEALGAALAAIARIEAASAAFERRRPRVRVVLAAAAAPSAAG